MRSSHTLRRSNLCGIVEYPRDARHGEIYDVLNKMRVSKAPFGSSVFFKYSRNTSVSKNNKVLDTSKYLVPSNTLVLKTEVSPKLQFFWSIGNFSPYHFFPKRRNTLFRALAKASALHPRRPILVNKFSFTYKFEPWRRKIHADRGFHYDSNITSQGAAPGHKIHARTCAYTDCLVDQ